MNYQSIFKCFLSNSHILQFPIKIKIKIKKIRKKINLVKLVN